MQNIEPKERSQVTGMSTAMGFSYMRCSRGRGRPMKCFADGLNLHSFAKAALSEQVSQVVDPASGLSGRAEQSKQCESRDAWQQTPKDSGMPVVAGLDIKTASCFSAFLVAGVSVTNVVCNFLYMKSPDQGQIPDCLQRYSPVRALLVAVSQRWSDPQPCLPGVAHPVVFVTFLAWSTFKTCRNGILCW
ncbi:hypothetical protein CRG98_045152 [Punica granatum]|uniref:Uncharacterized protein n=1 Tax=Punica granatum TaxID=22663 RepID=A0A2I0HRW6_PUNGR|nr:hypothetical protein CRG98_045152 [Punica granatum]